MKAILVIDKMPESCKDCRLKYFDNGDDAYFGGSTERCVIDGSEISISGRYDDCPLRPLPEKKKGTTYKYYPAYTLGWNDCLDEIKGEEE